MGDIGGTEDMMGEGEAWRRSQLWDEAQHRAVNMVTLSGEGGQGAGAPSPGHRDPDLAHLLPLADGSRSRVIRRNSLLGKRGAGIWCVLILGLRSSEGPRELQGGEGKAVL